MSHFASILSNMFSPKDRLKTILGSLNRSASIEGSPQKTGFTAMATAHPSNAEGHKLFHTDEIKMQQLILNPDQHQSNWRPTEEQIDCNVSHPWSSVDEPGIERNSNIDLPKYEANWKRMRTEQPEQYISTAAEREQDEMLNAKPAPEGSLNSNIKDSAAAIVAYISDQRWPVDQIKP